MEMAVAETRYWISSSLIEVEVKFGGARDVSFEGVSVEGVPERVVELISCFIEVAVEDGDELDVFVYNH